MSDLLIHVSSLKRIVKPDGKFYFFYIQNFLTDKSYWLLRCFHRQAPAVFVKILVTSCKLLMIWWDALKRRLNSTIYFLRSEFNLFFVPFCVLCAVFQELIWSCSCCVFIVLWATWKSDMASSNSAWRLVTCNFKAPTSVVERLALFITISTSSTGQQNYSENFAYRLHHLWPPFTPQLKPYL